MDSFEPDGNGLREGNGIHEGNGSQEGLPPPPPVVPPDVVPMRAEPEPVKKKVVRVPIARRGLGSKGQKISLLTNHFKVNVNKVDDYFFHYCVSLSYEDGRPVDGKGVGRKVIDRVHETYDSEMGGKKFAYDGEKSLFTVGALPRNKLEFTVVLEDVTSNRNNGNASPDGHGSPNEGDRKRMRRPYQSKTFKVEISFAAKIPMQAIANALRGQESENSQEAIRVLDIILRQHAAKQGCLLVRQNFFHNDPKNFADVGGGVLGCRGFHSSFRTTQGGLSLNIDVSTTMIIQPGPVVDFLIANQNVRDPFQLDWAKAKRTLKNLRIKASPSNQEYKITGLSEMPCKEQTFQLNQKGRDDNDPLELTVYDYFVNHRRIELRYSGDLPCINVGKPKRPTFIPIELCSLVSLQRYTKALNTLQRASLVEKSRQKPQERMSTLSNALKSSNYDAEPMLRSCGVSISTSFVQVDGRQLQAPKLKVGNGEDFFPRNGRWNFNNKKLVDPSKIERWAVVNFSARCDIRNLVRDLTKCAEMKGIPIEPPFDVFEENPQFRRAPPTVRVEKMFDSIQSKLPGAPKFLLCLLPERKNSDLYGPWKKKNLSDFGIVTQCIAPQRVNDQYLTNVLLKINAKLGGLNSMLAVEHSPSIPLVSKVPTIIIGMDVSHGSPGHSDVPSIAAVVSSRQWPLISRYRACVRTQSPKVEMIDSLYKPVSDTEDEGMMRELLLDFYSSSGKRKPEQIIIFRDGVSESQFNQVLNIELNQIIEACKHLDEKWNPKFVVIIAQKNHHTKFFQPGLPDNVPPGTVIDNKVCHPRNNDFYLCAHAGMIGTTRPTHYHVLLDEVGFSADELQELVHSLSYVYQRSTTAISVVAPVCYAHLAATQMGQFMKFEDASETSSSHGGVTSAGAVPVPQMPKLSDKVSSSMFFC
ncbi:protein argonaute 4 isoform X1 [Ricinus communis]|uniref:Eukaryotic translation initiation factor 2c, putative n=1 Tax=Ricinus communis TaxID=3988 RepID=B9SP45_RICCO|nr:protein argonaute 4 isoform X1 [Ricinus communis]XP_048233953.1 protein argonaute 4 isoform X1 [Ricinus communis]XP_048233954.1 protein argonaute 4 isoform X1 [Ricinus communis]XP_048233955.1 protein argonaute 4 isoform X1 [Ricinus communis]EEF34625.1 eukaryotic translation initiation factor 2c, putative [Ricinus communis]|eukprot:XP_002527764.1 protein argonaute 4 isoform X2 [Ricinus communis]